ncbi:fungal specific transcription factor [Colletotrichum asianum]
MEICYDAYDPTYTPPTPPKRSNIFSGAGYLVVRPSTGGIVVCHPSAVDLLYLNLPRTHDTCTSTPAVEDALATRMLSLGAPWWPSWATYTRRRKRLDDDGVMYDFHHPPDTHVGYPSTGGVWVVRFSPDVPSVAVVDSEGRSDEPRRTFPLTPEGWHRRIEMVLSMDEKCEVIRDFGGVCFESVEECEYIATGLEGGREMFGRFEPLLRRMEDDGCAYNWSTAQGEKRDDELESDDIHRDGETSVGDGRRGCVVS